ncbi:YgiW/YdeI family stress tolerance OB fold protein [Wohlfahrtiimonas populi]|uniref:YgiW/YdeI family stress tolerance OB fold protein n=1 Tax=Wohlfahrtiimonas populi TaxID=1940240 RepID=UPI00098D0476|nr:NirD/YgiW/YdeI family stress tolerance protein [Wohlfahrtiimonas populi]
MKKLAFITLMAATLSLASAQYTGPQGDANTNGRYNGPTLSQSITTVREAKTLRDDVHIKMRGKIVKHSHKDKYIFSDGTGEVTVEIDRDEWNGLNINADDIVEIGGEIDKDWNTIEMDVDYIAKVQ